MIPSTVNRVPLHTTGAVNEGIRRRTEKRVAKVAEEGPEAIDRRLAELDREWDIDRAVQAKVATIILLGSTLGAIRDRRFFAVPLIGSALLLMYALQGWIPPLPALRRAGFRTASEIDHERYALKALRGDFALDGRPDEKRPRAQRALDAARS